MQVNNTETKIVQPEPVTLYKVNTGITNLAFDSEKDLEKYSKVYITKEFDPFRIVHCCEAPMRDYKIQVDSKEGDKKTLFNAIVHYKCKCCNCCDQCIIGYLWCGYACCDYIQFQMDYKRNAMPFYTQGKNITKGCHCCDVFLLCEYIGCCACFGEELTMRENVDPDSPDIRVGRPKGKTISNGFCACDKWVRYETENNLRGQMVKAECCDIFKNRCMNSCCCGYCAQGFDFELKIENENRVQAGKVSVFSGCCSSKVEGKCCYLPRPYFEIEMPENASSEQKFQIIADLIHFDIVNGII